MNHRMWKNPVTRDNVTRLKRLGHRLVEPGEGWMACREHGPGRMAEPEDIVQAVVEEIGRVQDLEGVRVLVTAGRTEEPIDPVRVLTNRSSGKMGVALAEEARDRGADVTLLAGAMDVPPAEGVRVERAHTALDMQRAAERLFPACDVLVMAAAVGDFRPARASRGKLRRGATERLDLTPNPDILAGLAARRAERQVLVGFALETDASLKEARAKLARKGVDLLVVNDPAEPGAAIGGDTNVVTLLERGKSPGKLPVLPKREVAERIFDWVAKRRSTLAPGAQGARTPRRAG
jgi:phosphopantothenoylcysteine decarboxylase/phosphopantothenate--cysteine ligase